MRTAFRLVPCILICLASLALADASTGTDQAPEDGAWLSQAAVVLLFGFVLAVNIMKSKREHRD